MLDAILLDLDGTLLPMDNDKFTKIYFGYLAEAAKEWGYTDKEQLISAIWSGVKAMVENDGRNTNEKAFWNVFSKVMGRDCACDTAKFDAFYKNDFHKARSITSDAPLAREAVRLAREKAKKVILATNPIFPRVAAESRLSWIGLSTEDFDLVTDYSNSYFCKPNPEYYAEICKSANLDAEKCLMIGNDVQEDFDAAASLGMKTFIISDFLINRKNAELSCPNGSYADMLEYIKGV